jgi:low affinity Fe/Cu permease
MSVQPADDSDLPDLPPERESIFERTADWVSEAMGRPTNIIVWLFLVVIWTAIFAAHLVSANATFLPPWFTGQAYNFPLNLVTTVAELFIGFLVAAAANRAQRVLSHTLAQIVALVKMVVALARQIETVETGLAEALATNTALTGQVHELTVAIHGLISGGTAGAPAGGGAPGESRLASDERMSEPSAPASRKLQRPKGM